MTTPFQPFREPLSATLTRNLIIALVAGAIITVVRGGGIAQWPVIAILMLWPTFGGHGVELFYLNWLRQRLPASRAVHVTARLALWFAAGSVMIFGMSLTAKAIISPPPTLWPAWWIGGLGFIGIELIAQAGLQLRGQPSFYNGRA